MKINKNDQYSKYIEKRVQYAGFERNILRFEIQHRV